MADRHRIIVSGLVAASPVGGMAWHYLQYILGLQAMGHDVAYHEDTWSWPYDPVANTNTDDPSYSVGFIDSFFDRYAPELSERWHYRHLHDASFGMSAEAFARFAAGADLWINVSGASFPPEHLPSHCIKVFVDTDPGYNQMLIAERFEWAENVDRWVEQVMAHDVHFTFAENVNGTGCSIPLVGLDWIPTRMPIVLDLWRCSTPPPGAAWTTVMTWNAFKGPVSHDGRSYHSKGHQFREYQHVAREVEVPLTVALGGIDAPRDDLVDAGWGVVDGPATTRTAESYRDFILASRAEFSTAKHIYVATRSGWFSERTACYLAASRPAVVQDTGFSEFLPTGSGLMCFGTPEEAVEAIADVERRYGEHATAAREVAEQYFGSATVLQSLLDDAGATRRDSRGTLES